MPESGAEYRAPKLAPQLVAASYGLLKALNGSRSFEGALFWIRRWEIWSEQIDNAGVNLFDMIMKGAGSEAGLAQNPSILFDSSEFDAAYSITALPLLFQWDAYVIPNPARYFLYVSHNESWVVLAKNADEWKNVRQAFDQWDRIGDASQYLGSVI